MCPHDCRGVKEDIIKRFRINESITARDIRLIGESGEQLGIVPSRQALETARKLNLDLVEVAPTAVPPVCRLLDYGKFKYEQSKKEQEGRKRQKTTTIREVRIRPKISEHDLDFKIRAARRFLEDGDKVKVMVRFRGREMTHPEIATELVRKMLQSLKDVASAEKLPVIEGRAMNVIFAPQKRKESKTTKED